MLKKYIFICLIILLAACHDKPSNNSNDINQSPPVAETIPASAYLSCETVPSGTIITHNGCPGVSGTWNNYEVKMQQDGTLIAINLYCGGGDVEHPVNQAEYDGYASFDETSSADFKLSTYCASGTRKHNVSGEITVNIWQKI